MTDRVPAERIIAVFHIGIIDWYYNKRKAFSAKACLVRRIELSHASFKWNGCLVVISCFRNTGRSAGPHFYEH